MISTSDLTVGNTITIAAAIYKHNWRKFLKLSFVAHLWLLIPVYGWGRYCATAAWISRLSLNELSAQSHKIDHKQYFTLSSLILFLVTAFFTLFITVVVGYLIVVLLFVLAVMLLETTFDSSITDSLLIIIEREEGIAYWLFAWLTILCFSSISAGFYTRLFVTDLNFSNQAGSKIFSLIHQSFSQTKNNKLKVFKIIFIASVLSFSMYLSIYIFWYLIILISYLLDFNIWQYSDHLIIYF